MKCIPYIRLILFSSSVKVVVTIILNPAFIAKIEDRLTRRPSITIQCLLENNVYAHFLCRVNTLTGKCYLLKTVVAKMVLYFTSKFTKAIFYKSGVSVL